MKNAPLNAGRLRWEARYFLVEQVRTPKGRYAGQTRNKPVASGTAPIQPHANPAPRADIARCGGHDQASANGNANDTIDTAYVCDHAALLDFR